MRNIPLFQSNDFSSGCSQLLAEVGELCCAGVTVDDWLVFDVASAIGVSQCVQALFEIDIRRTYTGDHHCPAVPTQRILQPSDTSLPVSQLVPGSKVEAILLKLLDFMFSVV